MKNFTKMAGLVLLLCGVMVAGGGEAMAQGYDFERAVLVLTGVLSMEELDEEVVDRFSAMASRPLRVNVASEARMVSSGLFSRYQAASVADYRRRNGDILSVMELMLVDGFDEMSARALEPFLSFEAYSKDAGAGPVQVETVSRASVKSQEEVSQWNYAVKLRVGDDDRWSVGIAAKSAYGDARWPPGTISGSLSLSGRGGRWRLVAGDFNTRFGQGLVQWSGFSLSGAQSAASFAKHPSGISPAWTLSPAAAQRGIAAEAVTGRLVTSVFASENVPFGGNFTYLARYGQLGLTALSSGRVSFDWRWSFGKTDTFGEMALDASGKSSAGVVGCTYNPEYQVRVSALARSYAPSYDGTGAGAFRSSTKSSDEVGGALAFDYRKLVLTADMAFHPSKETSQHKAVLKYSPQISEYCGLEFKAVSRYRPEDSRSWRNELRAGLTHSFPSGFMLHVCWDACSCRELSLLAFTEAGYEAVGENGSFRAYLRATFFKVDSWDDRIYVYERDVQGAFSVPAYYGRGWSCSGVAVWKWKKGGTLNIRASFLDYPWMEKEKPGKAELKCQLIRNF